MRQRLAWPIHTLFTLHNTSFWSSSNVFSCIWSGDIVAYAPANYKKERVVGITEGLHGPDPWSDLWFSVGFNGRPSSSISTLKKTAARSFSNSDVSTYIEWIDNVLAVSTTLWRQTDFTCCGYGTVLLLGLSLPFFLSEAVKKTAPIGVKEDRKIWCPWLRSLLSRKRPSWTTHPLYCLILS